MGNNSRALILYRQMSAKSYSSSGFNGGSRDSIPDISSISDISDFSDISSISADGSMLSSISQSISSSPSFGSISLLDYTDPENYMYYGAAAGGLLLIICVIMKKRGTFEKIKKVSSEFIESLPSALLENRAICQAGLQSHG